MVDGGMAWGGRPNQPYLPCLPTLPLYQPPFLVPYQPTSFVAYLLATLYLLEQVAWVPGRAATRNGGKQGAGGGGR